MKIFRAVLMVCFILILCLGAGLYFLKSEFETYARTPFNTKGSEIIFTVQKGEGFQSIAKRMEENGIVSKAFWFRILARIKHMDKRVHAGEYELSSAKSPMEILDIMVAGKVRRYRLTLPEGLRLTEIAKKVGEQGLVTEEEFLNATQNMELARSLGIPVDSFEGYLFPDTYFFTKEDNAESMIQTMVQHFKAIYDEEKKARAKELGLSMHEVVTLASIIEKETGIPGERRVVASVFHNRLKKKMKLETDPTVIYGIPNFDGDIRKKDLRTYTPYNTYMIPGLPPGPIASPGEEAIIACLWPDETEFIFFVSKNDGSHHFSKKLSEHNRAVQKYQRKTKPGKKK